jgi:hypothetical protein
MLIKKNIPPHIRPTGRFQDQPNLKFRCFFKPFEQYIFCLNRMYVDILVRYILFGAEVPRLTSPPSQATLDRNRKQFSQAWEFPLAKLVPSLDINWHPFL